ncbi:DUF2752 domain-containing protein [Thermodesulfobacteriota bacterium]
MTRISTFNELMRGFFRPVLAPLLQYRLIVPILAGIAALQVWLAAAGLPGWLCPIKSVLGIPCPGCGLSSSVALLFQNEWRASLHLHAFAPIFMAGILLFVIISILPPAVYQKSVGIIDALERRTGIIPFFMLSLIIYWLLRFSTLL